jgi:hypothetical protein
MAEAACPRAWFRWIGPRSLTFEDSMHARPAVQLAFRDAKLEGQGKSPYFFTLFFLYKYTGLCRNLGPLKFWGPVQLAHTAHVAARACSKARLIY